MRVLLIAPACDGTDVGESWVAHQWARGLSRHHDVTLLTYHKRGHVPAGQQLDGLRVVEWTEPPLLGWAERLNSMLAPGYAAFYFRARNWIRGALARGERFDVVHQPVPVAMRYPSPATGLGLTVIIGPVGGGLETPPAFRGVADTDPWYVRLRGLDAWRLAHDPLLRRTYGEAACVLGIAPYVADKLAAVPVQRLEISSETALVSLPEAQERIGRTGQVRVLFVGRLVRSKGIRDLIGAMGLCRDLPLTLDVIGDGPERAPCQAMAARLGLAERVTFHGRLPRAMVDRFYQLADIFAFPSYREPGGNVALEAMGQGLPVIVCDRGGPGAATTRACAVKVPVTAPEALVRDVAAALRRLTSDEPLRLAMGRAAYQHVRQTGLWEHRIAFANQLFAELAKPPRPAGSHPLSQLHADGPAEPP